MFSRTHESASINETAYILIASKMLKCYQYLFLPLIMLECANFFPGNLISLFSSAKKSFVLDEKLTAEYQQLFQAMVDEMALAIWKEPECTTKLQQTVGGSRTIRNPYYFDGPQNFVLLLSVVLKTKCLNWAKQEKLMEFYNKLKAPKNKEKGEWEKFFDFIKENYVELGLGETSIGNSWNYKVNEEMALFIGNKIRVKALSKILHELTKEGAKCLGIDLMEIVENGNTTTTDEIQPANSYKIQLDLDNLDKLKDCGIKLNLKWLQIDAKLFKDSPRARSEKAGLITIWDTQILEKLETWNAKNKAFKRFIVELVEKIVESKEIPHGEKGQYFVKPNENTSKKIYHFDLEHFLEYEKFDEFMKNLKEFDSIKRSITTTTRTGAATQHDVKEWFKRTVNRCSHVNDAKQKVKFVCAPIELTANGNINNKLEAFFQGEQFREELKEKYWPLEAEIAIAYLQLMADRPVCEQLRPFNFGRSGISNGRSIFVGLPDLVHSMFSEWGWHCNEEVKTKLGEIAKLKQFKNGFNGNSKSGVENFIKNVHDYYYHHKLPVKLNATANRAVEVPQVKAICTECWASLLGGMVDCFLKIPECWQPAVGAGLFVQDKSGRITTKMETLLKHDKLCVKEMKSALYKGKVERFTTSFQQITKIHGFCIESINTPEEWAKLALEIDAALNPDGKQFILKKEEAKKRVLDGNMVENDIQQAYKTLGVPFGSNLNEVRKAHRAIVLLVHPDKQPQLPKEEPKEEEARKEYNKQKELNEKARAKFEEAQEAYKKISDMLGKPNKEVEMPTVNNMERW